MVEYSQHVADPSCGRFIVFEGGEGVGKSTQLRRLRDKWPILFPHEKPLIITREPGGTPYAEMARSVLIKDEAKDISGLEQLLLVGSGRANHMRCLIAPKLEAGMNVISDRFFISTYVYQLAAAQEPVDTHFFWQYLDTVTYWPHLTLIFDIDPRLGLERVGLRTDQEANHFDAQRLETHQKRREAYLSWHKLFPQYAAVIDASLSAEEVHEQVVTCLRQLFAKK